MPQEFKYYMHECAMPEEIINIIESQGIRLSTAAKEKLMDGYNPFYEVTLLCEIDDKGEVTISGLP